MTETTTGSSNENGKSKSESDKEPVQQQTSDSNEASPPTPKEMRAIMLQNYGGLKYLKVLKKPEPTLGENEVLIRIKACGVNFIDLMLRQGVMDSLPKPPFILGFECAGEIEGVAEGVEGFKVGDRVAAIVDAKAWAELASVPAKYVYKIPDEMSYQDAVAITLNFVVAYCLLYDIGNLKDGQTILIHSVGGGVGQALVQLAKKFSDVKIIGTASKHKHEQLQDHVTHLFDYSTDYVQEVKKLYPMGIDLVLDCLCGEYTNKGCTLLKPLGQYVLYGTASAVSGETKSFLTFVKSWWQLDKVSPMKLYEENKTLSGFNFRHLLYHQDGHDYIRGVVEKVYKMYQDKSIKPVIDSAFAFEDVAEAMQKLHDRKNIGKVVLDPAMEPKPAPPEEENPKGGKRKSSGKDKGDEKDKSKETKASDAQNGDAEEKDEKKEKEAETK